MLIIKKKHPHRKEKPKVFETMLISCVLLKTKEAKNEKLRTPREYQAKHKDSHRTLYKNGYVRMRAGKELAGGIRIAVPV